MENFPLNIINDLYKEQPDLKNLLLKHSLQVRAKALQILDVSSVHIDREEVSTGALLHDIGIIRCHAPGILCCGAHPYIAHGILGAEMLRGYGIRNNRNIEMFARICERHTGSGLTAEDIRKQNLPLPERDFLPETMLEKLICLADKFFSKSGKMEEKSFERTRSSMTKFGAGSLERFDAMCRDFNISGTLPFLPDTEI